MKKLQTLTTAATFALALGMAGSAVSGQPENPGCFGQDRAATLHSLFIGNKEGELANGAVLPPTDDGQPGASRWGQIASERGATNGEQNRAYKEACGGNPSQPD